MDAEQPSEVERYLRRLDEALAALPADTAAEIRAGVAEELAGVEPSAVGARIEELGDPWFIAAEARAETVRLAPGTGRVTSPTRSLSRGPAAESSTYLVIAALLIAVGGVFVPFVGWLTGIVMMWLSPVWRRAEKWAATLGPIALGVVVAIGLAMAEGLSSEQGGSEANPLVPQPLILWNGIVLAGVVNVGVGVWLLVVGVRRARTVSRVAR